MKNLSLSIIAILLLFGCYKKPPNYEKSVVKKYWNFLPDASNQELIAYKDQPLYFSKDKVFFYNKRLASYFINGRSIVISDTIYLDKINVLNSFGTRGGAKKNAEFFKVIKGDSLYRIVYTYLIGEIEKCNRDSLIINKLEGYGLPFKSQEHFSFYNDSLQIDESVKLDSVQFSKSTCYGDCPNYAIKLSKNQEVKLWGGKNFKQRGFYQSEITNVEYSKLENLIKISNIGGNDLIEDIEADASVFDLIIYLKNKPAKRFKGLLNNYPLRIQNIGGYFNSLADDLTLKKAETKFSFQVELDSMEFDFEEVEENILKFN